MWPDEHGSPHHRSTTLASPGDVVAVVVVVAAFVVAVAAVVVVGVGFVAIVPSGEDANLHERKNRTVCKTTTTLNI